jgi:hypothetical protein
MAAPPMQYVPDDNLSLSLSDQLPSAGKTLILGGVQMSKAVSLTNITCI